jgi:hypothetical protein
MYFVFCIFFLIHTEPSACSGVFRLNEKLAWKLKVKFSGLPQSSERVLQVPRDQSLWRSREIMLDVGWDNLLYATALT